MSRLLQRSGRRFVRRHPLSAAVPVIGVALGVAVVLGVDLASEGAMRAMTDARRTLAGAATHRVEAPSRPLATEAFATAREVVGHGNAAPLLERTVLVGDLATRGSGEDDAEVFTLLGIDPFSEAGFRDFLGPGRAAEEFAAFLTRPGAAVLSTASCERLGVGLEDRIAIHAAGRRSELIVVGRVEPPAGPATDHLDGVLVVDLATAQECFGPPFGLDRIDLKLPPDAAAERLAELEARLPADVVVRPASEGVAALRNLTRSFRENLRALSLLSLFVGAFLVYSTLSFWVTQRRESLALMRLVGATGGQVTRSVLGQALWLGALGTALGLALGLLLSGGLTALVTRTLGDLYTAVRVTTVTTPPRSFVIAAGLGLSTTLVAALGPARGAAALPARRALSASDEVARSRGRANLRRLAALLLGVGGTAALPFADRATLFGYVGLFGWLAAACLVSPDLLAGLLARLSPVATRLFGSFGGLAVRGARTSLPRTWVATSALMAALAATTAIAIVVASFRSSVATWIEQTLVADLYVAAPSAVRARAEAAGIDPEVVRRLDGLPESIGLHLVRRVETGSDRGPFELAAVSLPSGSPFPYRVLGGNAADARERWRAGEALLVSEPLATRLELAPADVLTLATPTGELRLPIAGVFRDYASERGYAVIDHTLYVGRYRDGSVTSVAIDLAEGVLEQDALDRVRAVIPNGQLLVVSSNRGLRENTLEVFDRTFEITGVLRLLTLVVAGAGTFSALFGLALDRERELAVLRAIGATPGQVFGLVASWSSLLGISAGFLALPLGWVLAFVLARYVNRPAFGWSLDGLRLGPGLAAGTLVLAGGISFAAALVPAWRAAKRGPARGLREE